MKFLSGAKVSVYERFDCCPFSLITKYIEEGKPRFKLLLFILVIKSKVKYLFLANIC